MKNGSTGARSARRRVAGVLVAALLALGVALALPSAASAHAMLERTTPADGSVLGAAPNRVDLVFGEQVAVRADDIKVYDDALRRVDTGRTSHPGGQPDAVGVGLSPDLKAGTYSVTWQVVSADSHPVSGGYRFSIGHPSTVSGAAPTVSGPHRTLAVALGVTRVIDYLGLVLGIGLGAVVLALWPAGRYVRRVRTLLTIGVVSLGVGALLGLLIQNPYTAGSGFGGIADVTGLIDTARTRFGVGSLVRLGLAVIGGLLLGLLCRRGGDDADRTPARPLLAAAALAAVGYCTAMAWAGHSGTGRWVPLAMVSDVVHVTAVSLWLGGLVLLATVLVGSARAMLPVVAPRFSRLAFGAVVAIAVTGGFQAWREVRYPAAFFRTEYGLLVTGKIVGFLGLVALGNLARRWVAGHRSSTSDSSVAMFRRGVVAETGLGAAVLVLTAVLAHVPQAVETYSTPYRTTTGAGTERLVVDLDRAHTGPASLTVALDSGAMTHHVTGSLSLPGKGVGPLPVRFGADGRGSTARVDFAVPGAWQLDLSVETSDVSATTYRVSIPVR